MRELQALRQLIVDLFVWTSGAGSNKGRDAPGQHQLLEQSPRLSLRAACTLLQGISEHVTLLMPPAEASSSPYALEECCKRNLATALYRLLSAERLGRATGREACHLVIAINRLVATIVDSPPHYRATATAYTTILEDLARCSVFSRLCQSHCSLFARLRGDLHGHHSPATSDLLTELRQLTAALSGMFGGEGLLATLNIVAAQAFPPAAGAAARALPQPLGLQAGCPALRLELRSPAIRHWLMQALEVHLCAAGRPAHYNFGQMLMATAVAAGAPVAAVAAGGPVGPASPPNQPFTYACGSVRASGGAAAADEDLKAAGSCPCGSSATQADSSSSLCGSSMTQVASSSSPCGSSVCGSSGTQAARNISPCDSSASQADGGGSGPCGMAVADLPTLLQLLMWSQTDVADGGGRQQQQLQQGGTAACYNRGPGCGQAGQPSTRRIPLQLSSSSAGIGGSSMLTPAEGGLPKDPDPRHLIHVLSCGLLLLLTQPPPPAREEVRVCVVRP